MTAADTLITEFKLKDRFTAGFNGLVGALKSGLTTITTVGAQLGGIGAAVGLAVLKPAADLESLKNALKAVEGSTEGAAKAFGRLRELAKAPGLGFKESIQGYIQLRNARVDPKLAEDLIKQVANANARGGGDRDSFSRAMLAVSQIAGTEYLQGDELGQLEEARIPARSIIKDAFGTSDTQALKEAGVTSQDVLRVLVAELSKLERVSGSTNTAWENLTDAFEMFKAAIATPLLPVVVKVIEGLSSALERLEASGVFTRIGEQIAKIFDGEWLQSTLTKALTWILGMMDVLPGKMKDWVDNLRNSFDRIWNVTKKFIALFVAVFTATRLVQAIAAVVEIYKAWTTVTKTLTVAQVILTTAMGGALVVGLALGAGFWTSKFLDNLGDIGQIVSDVTGFSMVTNEIAERQKEFQNIAEGNTIGNMNDNVFAGVEKMIGGWNLGGKKDNRPAQLAEEQTRKLREIETNTRESVQIERRILGGGDYTNMAINDVGFSRAIGGTSKLDRLKRVLDDYMRDLVTAELATSNRRFGYSPVRH